MKLKLRAGLAIVAVLLTVACIHKTSGPATPWEKVTTANAVLAQSINTVARGTIAAQQSGVITAQQAAPILNFSSDASRDQLQINALLANKPSVNSVPAIKALIDEIGSTAQSVINSGGAGVKNPTSQQTISADIQGVVTAADAILTAYTQAAGGGQ